jgi:hypothetical protein
MAAGFYASPPAHDLTGVDYQMDERLPFLARRCRLTYPRRFVPHLNVSACSKTGTARRLNWQPQLGRLGKTGMGRHAWCCSTLSALGHFVKGIPFEEAEIGARNGRKTGTEL